MKYDKELVELIASKNFKTFWHCLDYLMVAGYSPMEAFGLSMKTFPNENEIFSPVAFARMNTKSNHVTFNEPTYRSQKPFFVVGLIDETNVHLSGFYSGYRDYLIEDKSFIVQTEVEETCEVINFSSLGYLILDYFLKLSKKHFGKEIFNIPDPIIDLNIEQPIPALPNNDEHARMILARHLAEQRQRDLERGGRPEDLRNYIPQDAIITRLNRRDFR